MLIKLRVQMNVFLGITHDSKGKAIGMIDAQIYPETQHGAILSCYVDNDWRRGGEQGVAQAMANRALTWIYDLSADVLIATYNGPSQRFFYRNGFTIPSEYRMLGKVPAQLWLRPPQSPSKKR